jgi:hypothetical protein
MLKSYEAENKSMQRYQKQRQLRIRQRYYMLLKKKTVIILNACIISEDPD